MLLLSVLSHDCSYSQARSLLLNKTSDEKSSISLICRALPVKDFLELVAGVSIGSNSESE